jgi:hypothetical protein
LDHHTTNDEGINLILSIVSGGKWRNIVPELTLKDRLLVRSAIGCPDVGTGGVRNISIGRRNECSCLSHSVDVNLANSDKQTYTMERMKVIMEESDKIFKPRRQ